MDIRGETLIARGKPNVHREMELMPLISCRHRSAPEASWCRMTGSAVEETGWAGSIVTSCRQTRIKRERRRHRRPGPGRIGVERANECRTTARGAHRMPQTIASDPMTLPRRSVNGRLGPERLAGAAADIAAVRSPVEEGIDALKIPRGGRSLGGLRRCPYAADPMVLDGAECLALPRVSPHSNQVASRTHRRHDRLQHTPNGRG